LFGKKSKPHSKDKPKPEVKLSKPTVSYKVDKKGEVKIEEPKEKVIEECLCCKNKCQCCEHPVGITTHFCQCKCHA